MRLSRRGLLKLSAAAAAAAATSAPLASTGALRQIRRFFGSRRIPALAATGETSSTLVQLSDLPRPDGEPAVAYAASPSSRGTASLSSALAGTGAQPAAQTAPTRRWVMVIDLAKCDGCRECTRACNAMHFIPPGQEWIRVFEMADAAGGSYWLPRPCMQCDNPPCVKVCPVSAVWKREDGIVMQDTSRCIGCRFCMAACPYQARSFNWVEPPHTPEELAQPYSPDWNFPHRKGTTEKCIFCPGLVKEGKLPGCVTACPMGAIYFGDQIEDAVTNSQGETVRLSRLLADNGGYRLQEELGTEPRVYYLPPRNRIYPAPPAEPRPVTTGAHP